MDTFSDTETYVNTTSSPNDKHNQQMSAALCTDTVASTDCDIGKLIRSGVNVQRLGREQLYNIFTHESNKDLACYPRTRLCESDCYRQFQPTWVKKYPWIHYST